jgi:hypothetical protein
MQGISDDRIRERAYQIWEREGRPHGRDYDHWVQARVELVAEAALNDRPRKAVPVSSVPSAKQSVATRKARPRSVARTKKQA